MPIDVHPARARGRTPEQVTQEQAERAGKEKARAITNTRNVPAKTSAGTVVAAPPDTRTEIQKYVDEIAPSGITGRLIKFGKAGTFVFADDGEAVPEDANFLALCAEVLIGWIWFYRDGETPPDRVCGLLYGGFILPACSTLGDTDETQWEPGLSGQAEDPWKHQILLPLQNTATKEFSTFGTTNQTGRRSIGGLLKHFDGMQKTNPAEVPVVRLAASGFNHRDERVGWVPVPQFRIIGRASRDDAARPELPPPDTSAGGDMDDKIPF